MIDLHLHLDGSLSKEDFIYLANKNNVKLDENFPSNIKVNSDCASLEEYLEKFDLPCSLLQDKESIIYAVKSLVKRLSDLNYIYAEIRFAPLLHLQKGLTQKDVIIAALEGLKEGLKSTPNFDANLILCCMRQVSDKTNIETIEAALEIDDAKIVAIDLAGPEAFRPTKQFENVFQKIHNSKLNLIIHAGEACGSESVIEAISLGAKRIGHGVHLSLDKETINYVNENRIFFEFCPTSNLQTKSLKTYNDVPLKQFLDNGVRVTINSDNMTVSDTDVYKEFSYMVKTFNLSMDDVLKLLCTSIDASFLKEKEKQEKIRALFNKISSFYDKISS